LTHTSAIEGHFQWSSIDPSTGVCTYTWQADNYHVEDNSYLYDLWVMASGHHSYGTAQASGSSSTGWVCPSGPATFPGPVDQQHYYDKHE
jgi:hypothetical protein